MRLLFLVFSFLNSLTVCCDAAPSAPHKAALDAAMRKALEYERLGQARRLLNEGADVNTRNDIGQTVLEEAAQHGEYDSALLLLDGGANVNSTSNYGGPLAMAAWQLHPAVVRLLLSRGANPNAHDGDITPLISTLNGATEAEDQTTQMGPGAMAVSVSPDTPANRKRAAHLVKLEQLRLARSFALTMARMKQQQADNCLTIVRMLLTSDADVNLRTSDGRTALMAAARLGDLEALKLLIAAGADIRAKTREGDTILMSANFGAPDAVRFLLEHGASVNEKNDRGYTALMTAGIGGAAESIRLLVDAGAYVNAQNDLGDTALTMMTSWNNLEAVKFLLAHGADPNLHEKKGPTTLQLAKDTKNSALITLLERAGAK